MSSESFHLYFHAPCFDGLVSAVLVADYLKTARHAQTELHPVNYHLNSTWEHFAFSHPVAIVDFMYHPAASIWFDHHATTFLTPAFESHFSDRRDPLVVYDRRSPSCAQLIWKQHLLMRGEHQAKVDAAAIIDAARYASPNQAVFGEEPAMIINASMSIGEPTKLEEYSVDLVRLLLDASLEEVASSPDVRRRYEEYRRLRDQGLERFEPSSDLTKCDGFTLTEDGIFVFSVDGSDAMISRYVPFTIAPNARYSLGLVRMGDRGKITAMRNPWWEFESVPLGEIFRHFGGGGHQRVASARLHDKSRDEALAMLLAVKQALQSAINHQARGAPA